MLDANIEKQWNLMVLILQIVCSQLILYYQSYKWVIVIWTEHTSTVYLGGPEGPPPLLGARSAEIFEI